MTDWGTSEHQILGKQRWDNYIKNVENSLCDDLKFLTHDVFEEYFEKRGLIAASYVSCIREINKRYISGERSFLFYTNPHKLTWFITDIKKYDSIIKEKLYYISIRDFKFDILFTDIQ